MNKRLERLRLEQMDAKLAQWQGAHLSARPLGGWVRAIREALGMTGVAFARRLGISSAGVRQLENAEENDAITLATLRKLAQALDCELQYALVPRTSLKKKLEDRAMEVAREQLHPVSHSMSLEDQAVQGGLKNLQLELIAQEILNGPRRKMW